MKKIFLLLTLVLSACSPGQNQNPTVILSSDPLVTAKEKNNVLSFDFGGGAPIVEGDAVADKLFTVVKDSSSADSSSSTLRLNSADGAFFLVSASGCNRLLTKNTDICYPKIRFLKNKVAGSYSASLLVGEGSTILEILLTAEVQPPAQTESFAVTENNVAVTTPVDFGTFSTVGTSVSKIFAVTNTGTKAVVMATSFSQSNTHFTKTTDSCNGVSLNKGSSCYVKIAYKSSSTLPSVDTQENSTLAINSFALSMKALEKAAPPPPAPTVADIRLYLSTTEIASVEYGLVAKNTSLSKVLTLKNSGSATSAALPVSVTGSNFVLSSNTCPSIGLSAGASCLIRVNFNSGAGGLSNEIKNGNLAIASLNYALQGTTEGVPNTPPNIKFYISSVATSSYNFGPLSGTNSTQIGIMVVNDGGAMTAAQSLTSSLDPAFVLGGNNCNNVQLATSASCVFVVTFSAANQSLGSKTGSASFAGSTINFLGSVSAVQCGAEEHLQSNSCVPNTYTANSFSAYSPSSLAVCEGSVQATRSILSCMRDHDQVLVSSSNCVDPQPTSTILSPSGSRDVSISNGTETQSCGVGESSWMFVSRSCSLDFHDSGSACVGDTYSVSSFSPYTPRGQDLAVCSGSTTAYRTIETCLRDHDQVSVDISKCSDPQPSIMVSSPEGTRNVLITHGSEDQVCAEGSINWTLSQRNCDEDFYNDGEVCAPAVYIPTYGSYNPPIPVSPIACDGTTISSREITNCMQDDNGQSVSISKCYDGEPVVSSQSPPGEIQLNISNGFETYYCDLGSSVQSFVSRTCDLGFQNSGSACISAPTTSPVNIEITGDGTGSVSDPVNGISCNLSSCSNNIPIGTTISLMSVENSSSVMGRWTGDCAGQGRTCSLVVGSTPVNVGVSYYSAAEQVLLSSEPGVRWYINSFYDTGVKATDGNFYFAMVNKTEGFQIYKSNGAQVTKLTNLPVDPKSFIKDTYNVYSGSWVQAGNNIFFSNITTASGADIWKFDITKSYSNSAGAGSDPMCTTTSNNPCVIRNSAVTALNTYYIQMTATNEKVYYYLESKLWVFDSSKAANNSSTDCATSANPCSIKDVTLSYGKAQVGNKVYFSAPDGASAEGLWATDGTSAGTQKIHSTSNSNSYRILSSGGSNPKALVTIVGAEMNLYALDSTTNSMTFLKNMYSGNGDYSNYISTYYSDTAPFFNNKFYFPTSSSLTTGRIWESDGTPSGTLPVTDLYTTNVSSISSDLKLVGNNGTLLFVSNADGQGRELWKYEIQQPLYNSGNSLCSSGANPCKIKDLRIDTVDAAYLSSSIQKSLYEDVYYIRGQSVSSLNGGITKPIKTNLNTVGTTYIDINQSSSPQYVNFSYCEILNQDNVRFAILDEVNMHSLLYQFSQTPSLNSSTNCASIRNLMTVSANQSAIGTFFNQVFPSYSSLSSSIKTNSLLARKSVDQVISINGLLNGVVSYQLENTGDYKNVICASYGMLGCAIQTDVKNSFIRFGDNGSYNYVEPIPPLVLSSWGFNGVTRTSVSVRYTSNIPTKSKVVYYNFSTGIISYFDDNNYVLGDHVITVTGLTANTLYGFSVYAESADGQIVRYHTGTEADGWQTTDGQSIRTPR